MIEWLKKRLKEKAKKKCERYGHIWKAKNTHTGRSAKGCKIVTRTIYECERCGKTRYEDEIVGEWNIHQGLSFDSGGVCSHCKNKDICLDYQSALENEKNGIYRVYVYAMCPYTNWEPEDSIKDTVKHMIKHSDVMGDI